MRSLWSDSNKMLMAFLMLLLTFLLGGMIFLPLWEILQKSLYDGFGHFVFLDNFILYLSEAKSFQLIQNSLFISVVSTLIVIPIAFVFAYALMRSLMPLKPLFRYLALIPLLAPSLLPAISFVYLFGNQGFLKSWMGGSSIYGAWGYCFGRMLLCVSSCVDDTAKCTFSLRCEAL